MRKPNFRQIHKLPNPQPYSHPWQQCIWTNSTCFFPPGISQSDRHKGSYKFHYSVKSERIPKEIYIYIYNIYLYFERESLCSSQILIFIRIVWSAFKSTNSSALLFRNSNFYGLGWLGVQGSLVLKEEVHISPFKKHCFNCVTKDIMSAIHIS